MIFKLLLKNFKLWMLGCQNKLGMVADFAKVLQSLRIIKLSINNHGKLNRIKLYLENVRVSWGRSCGLASLVEFSVFL